MRERIVDAATDIIFECGLGALTLASTGARVGLRTTSITHYFKRKDDLAAACFERSLERLETLVGQAEQQSSSRLRVAHYLEANIALLRRVRLSEDRPIPALSGILSISEPWRQRLVERYRDVFRRVRGFFGPMPDEACTRLNSARAHVLQEVIFWLPASLRDYAEDDFERFGRHLFDIFDRGMAAPGATWKPQPLSMAIDGEEPRGYRELLRAATLLINERGYSGASVNRIVAQLNLTKGSFYHRLESREDLTLDCFFDSFRTIARAQSQARGLEGDGWLRLTSTITALLGFQFSDSGPLLRTTALQALPAEARHDVMRESDRVARRFSGLVVDAMLDGSLRLVDPMVAGQALMAMINAAYVMKNWASRQPHAQAIALYASTILSGLFSEPPGCAAPDERRLRGRSGQTRGIAKIESVTE
jgi:AcrR family transcriptional regulator